MSILDKLLNSFQSGVEDARKRLLDEGWFQRGLHADLRESPTLGSHSFSEQLSCHRPSGREGPEQQHDQGIDH